VSPKPHVFEFEDKSGGPLLEVDSLKTHFLTSHGIVRSVDGVSFNLNRGETMALVGESGSGKTVLARSVMGLLPSKDVIREGVVRFGGTDISHLEATDMLGIWGAQIAMIFQDPVTSLNPVVRIGRQITESLRFHLGMSRSAARKTAVSLLRSVGMPDPEVRMRWYPYQFSGGMCQRIVIAIALSCGPKLLLADEPTTGVDVTVSAQILDLLHNLQQERQMSMILITHDLSIVTGRADNVAVMYAGKIVEMGPTETLFRNMKMPYTEALLKSVPRLSDEIHARLHTIPGNPPNPAKLPPGCRFANRCPYAQPRCRREEPPLRAGATRGHVFACWYPVGTPEGEQALRQNQALGGAAAAAAAS
jgi:peptide/nickel transport system ATP-binding protein